MELFINIAVCELAFIWLERYSQYAIHSTQQSLPQGETKAPGLAGRLHHTSWTAASWLADEIFDEPPPSSPPKPRPLTNYADLPNNWSQYTSPHTPALAGGIFCLSIDANVISFPVKVRHYREHQQCYRRASMDWFSTGLQNFAVGCAGALAPESWRLYNLRTNPRLRWSLGYVSCTIPFLIVGGFISWTLEPTTKWAAFYSGLTAPILLTAAMKDTAKSQKELEDIEAELKSERIWQDREQMDLIACQQRLAKENSLLRKQLNDLLPEDKKLPDETGIKISFGTTDDVNPSKPRSPRAPDKGPYIIALFLELQKNYQKAKNSNAFQNFLSGLF